MILNNAAVENASFANQDLTGSDLCWSTFINIDFSGSILDGSLIQGAKFIDCNLSNVSMINVGLQLSTIKQCNLTDFNIAGTELSGNYIEGLTAPQMVGNLLFGTAITQEPEYIDGGLFPIYKTSWAAIIGCETHTLAEWAAFTDEQIDKMHPEALDWWNDNKHLILGA